MKKLVDSWRRFRQERRRYKQFIKQAKIERDKNHAFRELPTELIIYDMQEGMLPHNWKIMHPKSTGKHFTDYKRPKTKKK